MLRLGDKSPDVLAWQGQLVALGAHLTVDGIFGQRTHNATLAFQASHGLPTTGEVGPPELKSVAAGEMPSRALPVLAHSIPLVLARFYSPKVRKTVDHIVLHSMEAPEASTTAENVARYFATMPVDTPREKQASAHNCIDSDSVIQCVPDHVVAFHARGFNAHSLGLEHAGYARQTREEWLDAFGERMLELSVQLCARKCRTWSVPPVIVRAEELAKCRWSPEGVMLQGQRGITTHAEVNLAIAMSSHTDPGEGFPLDWYGEQVARRLASLGGSA